MIVLLDNIDSRNTKWLMTIGIAFNFLAKRKSREKRVDIMFVTFLHFCLFLLTGNVNNNYHYPL